MKAVVLAPGPSLKNCPAFEADLTIGINRAASFGRCDVWAALDLPLILNHGHEIIGSPLLFTRQATADSLKRRGRLPADAVLCEELTCPVEKWDLYTLTATLVLAAHKGATAIDVHGCDWTDAPDWDGTKAGENRGEGRWDKERKLWTKVTGWLNSRGVEVRRWGSSTT